MHNQDKQDEPLWGTRINRSGFHRAKDCPGWANPLQREKWGKQGLVLWDHESHQVTRLKATQALWVLNHLRTNDDWKQCGITVGEPVMQIWLDDPERKAERVLGSQMDLDPIQVQELFDLLEGSEALLKEISEQEEKERRQALHRAYSILLGEEV